MKLCYWFCLFSVSFLAIGNVYGQYHGSDELQSGRLILSEREEVKIMNGWLEWKRENMLPEIMRGEGIDMWIVRNNEGPVYVSLLPVDHEGLVLSSPSFLVFHDRGGQSGVERLEGRFADLPGIIKERDPKKIGINMTDEGWHRGDGFTPADREKLERALGDEYVSRLGSAANVSMEWLTQKTPQELSVYRYVLRTARSIIAEAFSNDVIIPDVTTTEDLNWWMIHKYLEYDFLVVDHPSVWIMRSKEEIGKYPESAKFFEGRSRVGNGVNIVIRRGDLIGLDSGIKYLGINTDTKAYAYVLKEGETDAPAGLNEGLRKGNRVQDFFMKEWEEGRTGDEIARAAAEKAIAAGLRPRIYSHPISYFLKRYGRSGLYYSREHFFAGTSFNSQSRGRGGRGGRDTLDLRSPPSYYGSTSGDYPLHYNTITAFELSSSHVVPEWGNQDIEFRLEEDVMFTERGVEFLDDRQTEFHIIR